MSEKLTIEKFGEIMDGFLQENEIDLLITLPEGSMDPKLQDNAGMGACGTAVYTIGCASGDSRENTCNDAD